MQQYGGLADGYRKRSAPITGSRAVRAPRWQSEHHALGLRRLELLQLAIRVAERIAFVRIRSLSTAGFRVVDDAAKTIKAVSEVRS